MADKNEANSNLNALKHVTNTIDVPGSTDDPEDKKRDNEISKAVHEWNDPTPFDYENLTKPESAEWAGNAARYEWKDEYGDVGPANEELERQLFEVEYRSTAGARFHE